MRTTPSFTVVLALGLALLLTAMPDGGLTAQPREGLATQEHEVGGVDLTLLEVKRTSGDTLTVKWKYDNKTGQKKQLTTESTGWMDPYRLSYGSYVLDTLNKEKHFVITDEQRRPIAGRHGEPNGYIVLGPKQSLVTWAKFVAPPANVEAVTVVIAGVAPFEDIPIAK